MFENNNKIINNNKRFVGILIKYWLINLLINYYKKRYLHRKYDFTEVFKNLDRYKSKNNFINQNNYVGKLKRDE